MITPTPKQSASSISSLSLAVASSSASDQLNLEKLRLLTGSDSSSTSSVSAFNPTLWNVQDVVETVFSFLTLRDFSQFASTSKVGREQVQQFSKVYPNISRLMNRLFEVEEAHAINQSVLLKRLNVRLAAAGDPKQLSEKQIARAFTEALFEIAQAYLIRFKAFELDENKPLSSILFERIRVISCDFELEDMLQLVSGVTEEDDNSALLNYSLSAGAGNGYALYALSQLYSRELNLVEQPDDEQSAEFLIAAAEAGNATAQTELAARYEFGSPGIEVDVDKSLYWLLSAAALDDAQANNVLGVTYRRGDIGREKDFVKSQKYLEKAVQLGSQMAMWNLAIGIQSGEFGLEKDETNALKLFQRSAELGNQCAINHLGYAYQYGLLGLEKNEAEALRLYMEVKDLPAAKVNLALAYKDGLLGLEQNSESTMIFLSEALDTGDSYASYHFGQIFEFGIPNVPICESVAVQWYVLSATDGCSISQCRLGKAYQNGELGLQINNDLALDFFRRAAEQEDPDAIEALAQIREASDEE